MKKCTRQEAIDDLRKELDASCDDEHSVCQMASEHKLFCRGFAQWKFGELRERYPQIVRSRPALTRAELEELANRWQLARQYATGVEFACDVQPKEGRYQQCKGWDEFDDEAIARFHEEICGEQVEITG